MRIHVLISSKDKENISFAQKFTTTFPYDFLKYLLEENQIPSQYGGSTSSFKHIVCNYSFTDTELSTDSSILLKSEVLLGSSFVYDVKKIQNLKYKIEFFEASIEELVFFIIF